MILAMSSIGLAWVLGVILALQNLKTIKVLNEKKFGKRRKELWG